MGLIMSVSFFDSKKNVKRALVLGGGGARGAFEIGVWKALNELNYQPDIVTGTSVGALNGALFLQDTLDDAEKMWKQIETSNILEYTFPLSMDSFHDYQRSLGGFFIKAIRQNGFSSRPLKKLIDQYLNNEKIIRDQKIVFGLSLTNYRTREIEYIFLKDIPHGKLKEYLLASSSLYPAMEKTYINGTPYIDGGYRNNMPIRMALDQNPDEVIVVDVQGSGLIKKTHRLDHKKVLWIGTKWPLGDLLLFHHARTELNIQIGYWETMKLAERYTGFWYCFEEEDLQKEHQSFYLALNELLKGERQQQLYDFIKKDTNQSDFLKDCTNKWEREIDEKNLPLAIMELTGKIFRVLPEKMYQVTEFQHEILYRVEQFQRKDSYGAPEELLPNFPLSGMEWTERVKEQLPIISNRRMILYILDLMEDPETDLSNKMYHLLFQMRSYPFVIALYINYLKGKQKNSPKDNALC